MFQSSWDFEPNKSGPSRKIFLGRHNCTPSVQSRILRKFFFYSIKFHFFIFLKVWTISFAFWQFTCTAEEFEVQYFVNHLFFFIFFGYLSREAWTSGKKELAGFSKKYIFYVSRGTVLGRFFSEKKHLLFRPLTRKT